MAASSFAAHLARPVVIKFTVAAAAAAAAAAAD